MTASDRGTGAPRRSRAVRRVQSFLHRRPGLRVAGLLALPMTWLVLVYLAPLALLFVTAFWTTDSFTGQVVREFTLENFQEIFTEPAYLRVLLRTVGDRRAGHGAVRRSSALPMAFFMARVAPRAGSRCSSRSCSRRCGRRTW